MLPLVLAVMLPLLPDQGPPAPSPGTAQSAVVVARAYAQLFGITPTPPGDGTPTVVVGGGKRRVEKKIVCGTTILTVDGSIDPKMAIAPGSKDVDPRMPRVPKPMCGERK
jgi:hypothetical protein